MKKKLGLGIKVAIAFGSVAAVSGSIVGFMKLYETQNKIGAQTIHIESKIDTTLYSKEVQEATLVDQFKNPIGKYDFNAKKGEKTPVELLVDLGSYKKGTKIPYDEFVNLFLDNFDNNQPNLRLKVGPFEFVNNYIESLSPDEFVDYTNWYFENVSWGPDLLTLREFRLSRGVKVTSGSITLGQHSGGRENSDIEFYPDAFFGSIAMYDVTTGQGNAYNSLLRLYNEVGMEESELNEYITKIPQLISFSNKKGFHGLKFYESLVGANNLYVFDATSLVGDENVDFAEYNFFKEQNKIQKPELNYVFEAQNFQEAKQKAFNYLQELALKYFFDVNLKSIDEIDDKLVKAIDVKEINIFEDKVDYPNLDNRLVFKTKLKDNQQDYEFNYNLFYNYDSRNDEYTSEFYDFKNDHFSNFLISKKSIRSLGINQAIQNNFNRLFENSKHWKDFYFLDDHLKNISLYVYDAKDDKNNVRFYSSKINAIEAETLNFDSQKLKLVNIADYEISSDLKLILKTDDNQQYILEQLENNPRGYKYDSSFDDSFNTLKVALGYHDVYTPKVIKPGSKFVNGKIVKIYQIYHEVYAGLLDKLINKKPYLAKTIEGEHVIRKTVDGVTKFELAKGEFLGFYDTDRIPFIALVSESDPSFKSTGWNYLKYVGTHEYGHHQTLQYIQDISEEEKSLVVGGISDRGGVSNQSYFSLETLKHYLDARSSGLDVRKVDVNYKGSENGSLINFSYGNKNNPEKRWETLEDVFGSSSKDGPLDFLKRKDRRFLQKLEELEEAAKSRGLKTYDLFLMNSLDFESGTINPTFDSSLKDISKLNAAYFTNEDENFKFEEPKKEVGLSAYAEILKDGLGNRIELDKSGSPIIYKSKNKDGLEPTNSNEIEVVIYKKDGNPVIDKTAYFIKNTPESFEEEYENFQNAASSIQESIEDLFVLRYANIGWNKSNGVYRFRSTYPNGNFNPSNAKNEENEIKITKYYLNNIDLNTRKVFDNLENNSFFVNLINSFSYDKSNNPNSVLFQKNKMDSKTKEIFKIYKKIKPDINTQNARNAKIIEKAFKDNEGNKYFSKPFMQEIYYNRFAFAFKTTEKLEQHFDAFESSNKLNTQLEYVKSKIYESINLDPNNVFVNLSSLEVSTSKKTIQLILPPYTLSELNEENINTYINSLNETNTKIRFNFINNSYNPSFTKWLRTDGVNFDLHLADSENEISYIDFKNFDQYLNFFSLDVTKYNATKQGDKWIRNWDKEYLNYYFDLQKVKSALESIDKKSYSEEEFNNNLYRFNPIIFSWANSNFINYHKAPPFKLSELKKYKYLLSGETGLNGYASFGINYPSGSWFTFSPNNPQWKKLQNNAWSINQNITLEEVEGKLSVDKVIETITQEIKKDAETNDDILIDLNVLLHYTFGQTHTHKSELHGLVSLLYNAYTNDSPSKLGEEAMFDEYISANNSRVESDLSSVFGDYVYNISEILTRDYTQITFAPSKEELNNLPNYVSGLSDYNTGNEYVFAGSNTKQWLKRIVPFYTSNLNNSMKLLHFNTIINNMSNLSHWEEEITKNYNSAWKFVAQYQKDLFDPQKILEDAEKEQERKNNLKVELKSHLLSNANIQNAVELRQNKVMINDDNFVFPMSLDNLNRLDVIGTTKSLNNGFFKDRWLRKIIGWEIYDDERNPIIDENISITELNNKDKVNDRARALWLYTLKSQGIGDRTLSGVYRNKESDSTLLWGFLKKEDAKKVKYLVIENEKTGKKSHLEIATEQSNNMFYLKKQADLSSKWTLNDEGYVSWNTNYAILSNYTNALVDFGASGTNFRIYFGDANKNEVFADDQKTKSLFDLGSRNNISENGKEKDVAPISVFKKDNKTYIKISNQFSI